MENEDPAPPPPSTPLADSCPPTLPPPETCPPSPARPPDTCSAPSPDTFPPPPSDTFPPAPPPDTCLTLPAASLPTPASEGEAPVPDVGSASTAAACAEDEAEFLRMRSIAEDRLSVGSVKSALKYARRARRLRPDLADAVAMVSALKTLRADPSDPYSALHLPQLAPLSAVRHRFHSLSTVLQDPSIPGAKYALVRVSEAFALLSDHTSKRDVDRRLRTAVETFWTACGTCRLLHEFERRHLGHRLLCPRCRKSFLAVEVPTADASSNSVTDVAKATVRVSAPRSKSNSKPRVPSGWSVGKKKRKNDSLVPPDSRKSKPRVPASSSEKKRKFEALGSSKTKKSNKHAEKTLAELQVALTRSKEKGKTKGKERAIVQVKDKNGDLSLMAVEDSDFYDFDKGKTKGKEKENGKERAIVQVKDKNGDLSLMAVEDSDFYDFDKDRTEKSFKKGQVWAVYDDDDGMPRHYGLIDEVYSSNPFRVKMSWLDIKNNGDEALVLWEKSGYHISCGRFKVGRKVDINSVNFFSHMVECERAAKEVYRIYPKKGSVWALYGEGASEAEVGRSYDIVVFLTSYSEMNGLSMGYLEKVEGFKTVFKRREIGAHAVKWLEKDDVRPFSHQIPARKIADMEGANLPKECWELDPASLPSDLLHIGW